MRAARKALRGAAERPGEGVPRWRRRSYLSVSVKTEKHTLAFRRGKSNCKDSLAGERCPRVPLIVLHLTPRLLGKVSGVMDDGLMVGGEAGKGRRGGYNAKE
ncbi:unnamed protein product [Pleuronectes platessa]|uniref:Uncharacterized protein n=1 Tax=Pleuronectes platessa TaxID=8262 RepID=A0A9N7UIV5_PLEPL|nr:unnamed protein product [Pleuronectes platessa]